jgi:hypothetical protein
LKNRAKSDTLSISLALLEITLNQILSLHGSILYLSGASHYGRRVHRTLEKLPWRGQGRSH